MEAIDRGRFMAAPRRPFGGPLWGMKTRPTAPAGRPLLVQLGELG